MGIFTDVVDNTNTFEISNGTDKNDDEGPATFKHMSKTQTKFGTTLGDYWNNVKTRSANTKYR
jgi:hypothetical protein